MNKDKDHDATEDEKNQTPDGHRTESDTVEMSPEFQDMMDDEVISFCEEENSEMLKIMRMAGFKYDAD